MLSAQLRIHTRPDHAALERSLDLLRPGLTEDGYRTLLSGFYGFYRPLEDRLGPPLDAAFPTLMNGRRKAAWLADDLRALGVDPETVPLCADLPPTGTVGEALGVAYVLEGSTLGGQVIARHFHDAVGVTSDRGASFFSSYGERIPTMWRAFLAALDGWPGAADDAVRAAAATFDGLNRWMGPRVPA